MPTPASTQSKTAWRRERIARRAKLTQSSRQAAAKAVLNHVESLSLFSLAQSVGLYRATAEELDPMGLMDSENAAQKTWSFPRVEAKGVMSFRSINLSHTYPEQQWSEGQWGITEPGAAQPLVKPGDIELLVIPLLGCDDNGTRLGYGGGFYDRFLAQTDALRIGVGFSVQRVSHLPREDHDIVLDGFVSEVGFERFSERLQA